MKNFTLHNSERAFTLIEMMVTLGIFVMLSGAVISNYRSVNNSVMLNTLASKIAISMRQAQVSGLAVQEDRGGGNSFNNAYGIHFLASAKTTYLLFADRNKNKKWTTGETVQTYTLGNGNTIQTLCVVKGSEPEVCGKGQLNITFVRPNPDAVITDAGAVEMYSNASVVIQAPSGVTKKITIWTTGQVSIQ